MAVRELATGGAERGVSTAAFKKACRDERVDKPESSFAVSVGLLCVIASVLNLVDELEWNFKNLNVKKNLQEVNHIDLLMERIVLWVDSWRLTRWIMHNFPWIKNVLPPQKEARSVFKDKFIKSLVDKYITPENYEKLKKAKLIEFPVFNLTSGKIEIIRTHDNLPYETFRKFVLAAISIPSLYPVVKIDGNLYCDGGFVNNISIGKALFRCRTGDILLIFHNFPKIAPELETSEQWGYVGWLATERKHIEDAQEAMQRLNKWLNLCRWIEKWLNRLLPWRWIFPKPENKLFRFTERVTMGFIGKRLNLPLIKKVEFYPDHNLRIFKNPSPTNEEMREAFDRSYEKAVEIIRKEVLPYIL